MAKAGEDFEKLVTRVEAVLAPAGAEVKHDQYLKDAITGEERQVDGTIRFTAGSLPILITIESRDRTSIQDVTWIEQLATKRQDLGAVKTIAVSSTGFSKPAIAKAKVYGIEIRTVAEITDEDIKGWLKTLTLNLLTRDCAFWGMEVEFYDKDPSLQIDPTVLETFQSDPWGATIFQRKNQNPVGLAGMLYDWEFRGHSPWKGIPADGQTHTETLQQPVGPGLLFLQTPKGLSDIKHLSLTLKLRLEKTPITATRLFQYAEDVQKLVQTAEWDVTENGEIIGVVSVHNVLTSGELSMKYTPNAPAAAGRNA
jgi:hypothetical protein